MCVCTYLCVCVFVSAYAYIYIYIIIYICVCVCVCVRARMYFYMCVHGAGSGEEGIQGFLEFVYKQIVPACILGPINPSFDLSDGQTCLVSWTLLYCLTVVC